MEECWDSVRQKENSLTAKLRLYGEKVGAWNKSSFGNVHKRIHALKKDLCLLREEVRSDEFTLKEADISSELDEWFAREELLWRQRGMTNWLKGGEHNTTFFKAKATQRKERKRVDTIIKEDGLVACQTEEVLSEFRKYFENIF